MRQLTSSVAVILALFASGAAAEAQEVASTFEQLAVLVKPGDKVSVVELNGRESTGRVGRLTRDALSLDTRAGLLQLGEAEVAAIHQRRGDSLKNGAIIGAVAGAAYFGTLMAIFSKYNDGGDVIVPTAVAGGALMVGLGAAAGAGIDALISRRQVIYRMADSRGGVGVAPLAGSKRGGVLITVKF